MVLITAAKYLPIEFQIEIGQIPPPFLPFGCKRLYEFQRMLFEESKVVLSLPKSFKVEKIDWKKFENIGIEVLFVPDGLSLGESIVYCLNMNLPCNENVKILYGDTYFDFLEFCHDSLVVARVPNGYDWGYFDSKFQISNLEFQDKKGLIIGGYFEFSNVYFLIESLLKSQYDFIEAVSIYSHKYPLKIIENTTWKDFGVISSYFYNKKAITTQRNFNQLTFREGYFYKNSNMDSKSLGEMEWFSNFPKDLDLYIPKFHIVNSTSYKTEYLYLNTLSELFVFGKLSIVEWRKIFEKLKTFLAKLHSYKTNKKVNFNYASKTEARLQRFLKENCFTINTLWKIGDSTISLEQVLRETNPYIAPPPFFSFIHGDFCFSNVMYDFRSENLKTFDPRGLDFQGEVTQFGDSRYDIAKLAHSCIGLYDFIVAGFFECYIQDGVIELDFALPEYIFPIQEAFLEIFCLHRQKEFYAMMIHLFLSMLPLHSDNKPRQMAFFANALRLYGEFCKLKDNE